MHRDKPITMNMEILLGETILTGDVALTERTLVTEFLALAKDL